MRLQPHNVKAMIGLLNEKSKKKYALNKWYTLWSLIQEEPSGGTNSLIGGGLKDNP